jgi:hypothetical protein
VIRCSLFLTLVLGLVSVSSAGAAEQTFAEVRETLLAQEASLVVSGDGERVGPDKIPTPFSRLLGTLETSSRAKELMGLAKHDKPMVRVMAMVALAEAYPKQAFKVLEARRYSRVEVPYLPRGEKKAIKISEGRLVSKLLFNSNLLRWGEKARPLITVPLPASETKAKRFDWTRCALLADAETMSLGGSSTGFAGTPSRFYVLTKEICATAKTEEVLDLLGAKEPILRAAGLVSLTRRDAELAAKHLPKHFKDAAPFTLIEGCIAQRLTLGEVAKRLLNQPGFLN